MSYVMYFLKGHLYKNKCNFVCISDDPFLRYYKQTSVHSEIEALPK